MRVLRPRSHVTAWLPVALVVVLSATRAHAVEGEDPPEPLPAPAEQAPPDAGPGEAAPAEAAPVDGTPSEGAPVEGGTADAPASEATPPSDAAPATTTPNEGDGTTTEPVTPTADPTPEVAPAKRRLLDTPKADPAPVAPTQPEVVDPPVESGASKTTTPWTSATGWVALGILAGMVPVALGVATLALGVVGFAWTAATPVGAANAAIPFALVGCGLLGGVGLAGPIGSAAVAAVTAFSAWTSYDTETAMDVVFGGAPGFFLAGLSLAGLPCSCLAGGLSMVYLGAAATDPSGLLVAIGLALLSAGIGGAAMGSACMAPAVTGFGAWSSRRALDNEKERQRDELREERGRGSRAMAF